MAITGYEKPIEEYSKNELVEIAKKYTVYYQTDSGKGSISNYGNLTKEKLISIIKSDRNYQESAPRSRKLSRVEMLIKRISQATNSPDELMSIIQEIFDDTEPYPRPGSIYTFVYRATTPRIMYDKHPLLMVESVNLSGFKGFNVHWPDHRNYLWENVNGVFHKVKKGEEFDYLHDVPYRKILST